MIRLSLLLKGLKTNLFSPMLVFLTVLLTVLVLTANFSFEESVTDTRIQQLRETTMNTQILISAFDEGEVFELGAIEDILKANANVESYAGRYSFYAETDLEIQTLYFYAMDLERQDEIYGIDLVSGTMNFTEENGILVSSDFAEENGLALGDSFTVRTEAGESRVTIKAIAENSGFFSDSDSIVISGLSLAENIFELDGMINRVDVTLKELEEIDRTASDLNEKLAERGLVAEAKFNSDFYDSYVSTIVLALNLFVGFMVFLSVYIIYTVFKSRVYENMRDMMTLRSIGFSARDYRLQILGQSLILTVAASACACVLSVPFVRLLMELFLGESGEAGINGRMALVSVIAVNVVSMGSVWLTTRNVMQMGIVDVLKNNVVQEKRTHRAVTFGAGICFLVGAFLAACLLEGRLGVNAYFLSVFCALMGIVLLQNSLISVYAWLLCRIMGSGRGAKGLFARQLPFRCRSYTQSVSILVLVLTVATLATSISGVLEESMQSVYKGADIYIQSYAEDTTQLTAILEEEEVVETFLSESRSYSEIEGNQMIVAGIPVDQYIGEEYERVIGGSRQDVFSQLKEENTIVVTTTFAQNNNLSVGDSLTVEGRAMKIVGEVSSFEEMGEVLFVSKEQFADMFEQAEFELILLTVTGGDTETAVEAIREEIDAQKIENTYAYSVDEMVEENNARNQLIIRVIYGLCLVSLLISAISLVSSLIINMSERRRDFVIFQSVGVSRREIRFLGILEGLSMGMYGGIVGTLAGIGVLPLVLEVLSYYVGAMEYMLKPAFILLMILISCLLAMAAVTGTMQKYVLNTNLISEVRRNQ